jgi:hypothetical protein
LPAAHGSWTSTALSRAESALARPLVSYGAIFALQLRVIWNVWRYKDLTPGDTSHYYLDAIGWVHGLHDNIVYYPLYTDLWGTIVALIGNVYAAAMVHRIAIVLAASLLVLAVMRALLGPTVGLLVAVWWTVLSPNYDVYYENHLFGLLPILVAVLLIARRPGRAALGVGLAVLAGGAVLVRNELLVSALVLGLAIFAVELRGLRTTKISVSSYARAYGVPLAIACLLVGGAYWRSHVQGDQVAAWFSAKEKVNFCQNYAFNYQQRHPDRFTGNPFTDCAPLVQHDFGRPRPSLFQAAVSNPRAIGGFVAWNTRLLESGTQVGLFGATATGDNPSWTGKVPEHRPYALMLSLVFLAVVIGGLAIMARERDYRRQPRTHRASSFALLAAVVSGTLLVVLLTQRPQPEYMYGLTVILLALAGYCVTTLIQRFSATRLVAPITGVLVLALLVAAPSHYQPSPRPLHDAVERLQPVRSALQRTGSVLVTSAQVDADSICNYLAYDFQRVCTPLAWQSLQAQVTAHNPIENVLASVKATVIYVDPALRADPAIAHLLAAPRSRAWRQADTSNGPDGAWQVLIRSSA